MYLGKVLVKRVQKIRYTPYNFYANKTEGNRKVAGNFAERQI